MAAPLLSGCSFSQQHDVAFEVTGTADAAGNVTYDVPRGNPVTAENVRLPLTKKVTTEFGF